MNLIGKCIKFSRNICFYDMYIPNKRRKRFITVVRLELEFGGRCFSFPYDLRARGPPCRFGNAIVFARNSTCAPGIRYLTWWNVSGALCTCASDSARMEDAHMCARLINIAIYRAGVVAASMTNWRKCARPCKEYTVVGPVAHRAGTSSW